MKILAQLSFNVLLAYGSVLLLLLPIAAIVGRRIRRRADLQLVPIDADEAPDPSSPRGPGARYARFAVAEQGRRARR